MDPSDFRGLYLVQSIHSVGENGGNANTYIVIKEDTRAAATKNHSESEERSSIKEVWYQFLFSIQKL